MSQPLLATNRITVAYTCSGLQHKQRAYCIRGFDTGGGEPQVTFRDGSTGLPWDAAAQGIWNATRAMMATSVAAATAIFEELVGLAWVPLAGVTLTGIGLAGGTPQPAQQASLVLRDTAFKFIRVILLETTQFYVGHSPTGLTLGADAAAWVNDYNGAETLAGEPFQWQVSRGKRYILASGAVAGVTYDLNDKLKRARGLE
jgi:hypothetical protein